jgi:hypothetical protein
LACSSPRTIEPVVALMATCGTVPFLEKSIVPRTSPSAFSRARAASGPMSGRSSATLPTGTNCSSSARSPEILFLPSDSNSPLMALLPSAVASTALPCSAWPATLPVSWTLACGLAASALPVAVSFSPVMSRPATTSRSLSTVSERSAAEAGPCAVKPKAIAPCASFDSMETSRSAPLMSAASLPSTRLACPCALSAPEASVSPSTVRLPAPSRFTDALSWVRSASTVRAAAGSAAETASAFRLRSTAPSASEMRPLKPLSSASLVSEPLSIVTASVPRLPATFAVTLPATSGAIVGLSTASFCADTVAEIGPVRVLRSNASECRATATPSALASLVATEGSVAEMSSRARAPCPAALTESACSASETGFPALPSVSGRLGPAEVRSSAKSLAPFGLMVPDALPEILSPDSVA